MRNKVKSETIVLADYRLLNRYCKCETPPLIDMEDEKSCHSRFPFSELVNLSNLMSLMEKLPVHTK